MEPSNKKSETRFAGKATVNELSKLILCFAPNSFTSPIRYHAMVNNWISETKQAFRGILIHRASSFMKNHFLSHFVAVFLITTALPFCGYANNKKDTPEESKQKPAVVDARKASAKIDQLVGKKLAEKELKPNAMADDATFLRRAYLGIGGRIPTIEEAEAFHSSSYENKRERLISDLLGSNAFVSHTYNYWADVLRINRALGNGASQGEAAYQLWLKKSITDNKPYDEFVREMVSARGKIWENGAVGYYLRDRGMPLDNMSNTVRVFLGTRLECAQCHDHPFDKWQQMDYFKMAAFSYGMDAQNYDNPNRGIMRQHVKEMQSEKYIKAVGSKSFPRIYKERDLKRYIDREKKRGQWEKRLAGLKMTEKQFLATVKKGFKAMEGLQEYSQTARETDRQLYQRIRYISSSENEKRKVKLPHDYQYDDGKPNETVSAQTMFGDGVDLEKLDGSTIDAYSEWMTSKNNPTFTKVIANRLWKKVFGMGVFEPVDDITDQMQISNPELMTYLENLMRDLDYDMSAYLEILYNTKVWQRTANTNEVVLGEQYYFQGPLLRRMSAEQIWDSIVGLALPEVDSYRPRLKTQLTTVDRARLIYESMADLSQEDYIAMVEEIGKAIKVIVPKQEKIRDQLYKAREAENEKLYRAKQKELSESRRELTNIVSKIGHKKLHEAVSGEDLLASLGMSEMSMQMAMAGDSSGKKVSNVVLSKLPKPKMPDPPADLDKKEAKQWKKNLSYEYRNYQNLVGKMARASELESPARRGHFLREFGQSDREVIQNAANNASVPQALNLLNGMMVEALINKFAVFGNRLFEAETPEEKAKMIFQAMLTREPTTAEIEVVKNEIEQHGDKAYEGVVWALLNTQQFIFVQ